MEKLINYINSLTKEEKEKVLMSLRESENKNTISNKADYIYKFLFNYVYDSK